MIVCDDFVEEDYYSRDYCKYCCTGYGNYVKFGYINRSVQENHDEDCIYRLAVEILEEEYNE